MRMSNTTYMQRHAIERQPGIICCNSFYCKIRRIQLYSLDLKFGGYEKIGIVSDCASDVASLRVSSVH